MRRTDIRVGAEYAVRRGEFGVAHKVKALGFDKVSLPALWSHQKPTVSDRGEWHVKVDTLDGNGWHLSARVGDVDYIKPFRFVCEWSEWERREAEAEEKRKATMDEARRIVAAQDAIRRERWCDTCPHYRVQCLAKAEIPCPKV